MEFSGLQLLISRLQFNTQFFHRSRKDNYRLFMRTLNRLGSGILFEAMTEEETDSFMLCCFKRAQTDSFPQSVQGTENKSLDNS